MQQTCCELGSVRRTTSGAVEAVCLLCVTRARRHHPRQPISLASVPPSHVAKPGGGGSFQFGDDAAASVLPLDTWVACRNALVTQSASPQQQSVYAKRDSRWLSNYVQQQFHRFACQTGRPG